jgi:hypothetical protein
MVDILIRTTRAKAEHKMQDVIDKKNSKLKSGEDDPDWDYGWCFWTLGVKPKNQEKIKKVLFTDGKTVFAEGTFYGVATDDGKPCVEFSALKRVNYPQPKKAPTRGFTYVEDQ